VPVPVLNAVDAPVTYTDALTVVFGRVRPQFSVNLANNAAYYKLLLPGGTGRANDYQMEALEHYLLPSLSTFDSPTAEGFIGLQGFAGIMIRSASATPALANVSVI
jgi:hypothetical protein